MTCAEAENAFALSVVGVKAVTAVTVAREKAATVKSSGLLEVVEAQEGLEGIGRAVFLLMTTETEMCPRTVRRPFALASLPLR
jgi:hypothetical protein